MDPLSAVGLAASIVQFIEAGVKIATRLADFGAAINEIPKSFRQVKTELPLIVDGLRRINGRIESGSLDPSAQAALAPVISECLRSALQLNEVLEKTLPAATASTWERRKKAIASLVRDKEVDALAEALGKYLKVLTFHQIISATTQTEHKTASRRNAFWLVPFDRNSSFVGRAAVFKAIDESFSVKQGAQPKASLCGLGGIGKSQIALEYCYRRRQSDGQCSVFWVNAATTARFEESFKRIAVECGLTDRNESTSDAVLLAQDFLQSRHDGPWLMVIDNVDDQASFFREKMRNDKTPSQCLPRCAHGSLLFTTRTRDVAVDLANPLDPIMIAELDQAEGLQLVKERLQGHHGQDDAVVHQLLAELEYIPLAITQALAFISKRRKTVAQYLDQYRRNDAARTRLLAFEFADHGRQEGSLESIAKTWSLSFGWIRSNNPQAADLLYRISFLQHQSIPRNLLFDAEGENGDEYEDDFEDAVAVLLAYSFLDADDGQQVFDTHRLVQLTTRWWLQNEGPNEQSKWALAALRSVCRHFPKPTTGPRDEYWSLCESLLPHAELLLKHNFDNVHSSLQRDVDLERASLLANTARHLFWMGAYVEGESRMEESIRLREKHLGERATDTMASKALLVWALSVFLERPDTAAELGRPLLALRTEILGPEHPDTIDLMSDVAAALTRLEKYEEAEVMHREALARSIGVLGRHHLDTLNCMAHLADVLEDMGEVDEAICLQREAYAEMVKALGKENPAVLAEEHNLANMLMSSRETRHEGFAHFQHALAIKTKVLGIDHRETLVTGRSLVYWMRDNGQDDEALALCDAILAGCANGPRRDNPYSASIIERIRRVREAILEKEEDSE
jgi:hypothetical protein